MPSRHFGVCNHFLSEIILGHMQIYILPNILLYNTKIYLIKNIFSVEGCFQVKKLHSIGWMNNKYIKYMTSFKGVHNLTPFSTVQYAIFRHAIVSLDLLGA